MKKRIVIAIVILVLIIAGFTTKKMFFNPDNDSTLRFSGNIEVTEIQMSFRIAGQLAERPVDEGASVAEGQVLARLEKTDQSIAVAQAQANLNYAEAVLAELEAGSRQEDIDRAESRVMQARQGLLELQQGSRSEEIKSARAQLESAEASEQSAIVRLQQAKIDHSRYSTLLKEGGVSENVFETYETRYITAQNRLKETEARSKAATEQLGLLTAGPRIEQIHKAEALLNQMEAEYNLIKAGPRTQTIDQALAKVQIAREKLKQVQQQLSHTVLLAPSSAVVLSTVAEVGEYLNPAAPVLTLGKIGTPWLRAYIPGKALGRIKLNQKVTVSTDSYPDKTYLGRVSFISSTAEFTPKTVQTFEERVNLMFRIKVLLENQDNELKPGMPADGIIELENQ